MIVLARRNLHAPPTTSPRKGCVRQYDMGRDRFSKEQKRKGEREGVRGRERWGGSARAREKMRARAKARARE
eukprot:2647969-Pleurochrysis_carterae.AAC.1